MDTSRLNDAAESLRQVLQPLVGVSKKSVPLGEELDELETSLSLHVGTSTESKVMPLVGPIRETLVHCEKQILDHLKEIDGIIASTRSQVMSHMLEMTNSSGKLASDSNSISENEKYVSRIADVNCDAEIVKFSTSSLRGLSAADTILGKVSNGSPSKSKSFKKYSYGGGGVVWALPDRNPHYSGNDGIYMQKLKSCIENIHSDAKRAMIDDTVNSEEVQSAIEKRMDHIGYGEKIESDSMKYVPEYIAVLGTESGLGKSELVKEYCHQLRSSNTVLIAWITATDEASLVLSFRELAMAIKAVHHDDFSPNQFIPTMKKETLFECVNDWIRKLREPWVMVLDNLDSEELLSSQDFLPFLSSSSEPCTIIITSRLLDLPFRWEIVMEKKSSDMLAKRRERKSMSTVIMSPSHQSMCQEIHAVSSSKIGAVHMFPMSEEEATALALSALDEEIQNSSRWNRDSLYSIRELCKSLNYSPIAIKQAFSCVRSIQLHRKWLIENEKSSAQEAQGSAKPPIELTQVERIREYSHRLDDCRDFAKKALGSSQSPFTVSLFQTSYTGVSYACEKSGGRLSALDRALCLLAFISPSCFDIRMIASWFMPPNTPYLAKVQKQWRLPTRPEGAQNDNYELAEFEISVDSIFPVECCEGTRFSWRVFRTFERIKDCIDTIKKLYSAEVADPKSDFPVFLCRALPVAGHQDMMQEAIFRRRIEIQKFFEKLVRCHLWGRICMCDSMKELLGFSSSSAPKGSGIDDSCIFKPYCLLDVYLGNSSGNMGVRCDETFAKLITPLFQLGFVSIFRNREIETSDEADIRQNDRAEAARWSLCSMNRDLQLVVRSWLKDEGRFGQVQSEVIRFLNSSFRNAYKKYKRGSDVFTLKGSKEIPSKEKNVSDNTRSAMCCEQLIHHVLSALSVGVADCHDECFELSSLAYHFCAGEELYAEALFCATLCVDIITQREGSVDSVDDGIWHSYLADMLCNLGKGDEANGMYEHSLIVLRNACGQYDKNTFSVLTRFGKELFNQRKYKHSIKIMEEALKVCRNMNTKGSGGISGRFLENFSPSNPKSSSTMTNLLLAGQIEQLVQVLLVNAPDNRTIQRCLKLKQEQLSILRRAHGEYSLQVARCLNSIGELEQKDNSKKARDYFEDCLDVLVRCVGSDSREFLSPLRNLAIEEHRCRNFSEAKKLYNRALEIHYAKLEGCSSNDKAIAASVHDSLGMLLGDEGDHGNAVDHIDKGYKIYSSIYGVDNYEVAISLQNLAHAHHRMGDSNEAKMLYSKSLKILRQFGNRADEAVVARILNSLGEIYMTCKEWPEARQLFMECLSMRVNLYGEKHADTVAVMKNLSSLALLSGCLEEAYSIGISARSIQIELDGKDATHETASLTGHLAEISRDLAKFADAESYFKNSIALFRKVYGDSHPSIAYQLNNMASMFVTCNRLGEAETLFESSRDMLIKCHGKEHTAVANAIINLAKLNGKLGRYEKALTMHSEALGILLKIHGSENKAVANALFELSELLFLKGDIQDATDACTQSLGIRTRLYGTGCPHSDVVEAMHLLGKLRLRQVQRSEAEKMLGGAIKMDIQLNMGPQFVSVDSSVVEAVQKVDAAKVSVKFADMIEDYCRLLGENDLDSKQKMFEKCLIIRRSKLGEESESVADTMTLLGDILFQKREYVESMEVQRLARAVQVKVRGESHPSNIVSLNGIAKCLKALGRLDEARTMFEQCVVCTRRLYGDNNFSTSVALYELTRMLQLVEEYDAAITMAEQSLRIRKGVEEQLNGKPCPAYGGLSPYFFLYQLHQVIGELSQSLNDAKSAKIHFINSRSICIEELGGIESEEGILAMEGLSWALRSLGSTKEADNIDMEITRCTKKVYESTNLNIIADLKNMGKVLCTRGKYAEAKRFYSRAYNICRVVRGDNHGDTVSCLQCLSDAKQKQDAENGDSSSLDDEAPPLQASFFNRLSMFFSENPE